MKRVLIIAEAGVNHNADINLAMRMIDVAKDCGADIIKFQTGIPQNVISRYASMAEYQKKNIGVDSSQLEMARDLALPYESFAVLKQYAESVGIEFLSTPFDIESANYLHSIGVHKWKIPSGEITNLPYLRHIARFHEPIVLSTGMSHIEEVRMACEVLASNGAGPITLLHCTTDYPAKLKEVNLKAILTMKEEFKTDVGYSDHTAGITVPIAAVALGATIIEKHFTLDRSMKGPDHKASLEPEELKKMIAAIRDIEIALGDGKKEPQKGEISNVLVARKSIVAKKRIIEGELFSDENITTKRPGTGISPMLWDKVLGLAAPRDFEEDELIDIKGFSKNIDYGKR